MSEYFFRAEIRGVVVKPGGLHYGKAKGTPWSWCVVSVPNPDKPEWEKKYTIKAFNEMAERLGVAKEGDAIHADQCDVRVEQKEEGAKAFLSIVAYHLTVIPGGGAAQPKPAPAKKDDDIPF